MSASDPPNYDVNFFEPSTDEEKPDSRLEKYVKANKDQKRLDRLFFLFLLASITAGLLISAGLVITLDVARNSGSAEELSTAMILYGAGGILALVSLTLFCFLVNG